MPDGKLSAKQFEDLLLAGEIHPLERALNGMTSNERLEHSTTALKIFRKSCKGKVTFAQNKVNWEFPLGLGVIECATIAAICTAEPEELLALNWSTVPDEYFDRPIYEQLKPAAVKVLGEIILSKNLSRIGIVRKLYKAGVIAKPTSDKYYLALYALHQNEFTTLAEFLLDNRDIIDEDLWHFFEIEGNGENSLAAKDKYSPPHQKWETAIVELSQAGHIDRQRLLTQSLKALARGFAQFRAAWYSSLHESLAPTAEERSHRIDLYGDLLASPVPPTVSFALRAIDKVDQGSGLSGDFIKQYLPAVMTSTTKGVLLTALSILDRAVKRDSALAASAGSVACQALNHPTPDIQAKALSFIKKHLDKEQIIALQLDKYSEGLVPSARAELAKDDTAVSLAKTNCSVVYTHREQADSNWPLKTNAPIAPIATIDELIERAAYCIENHDEVIEIERVMDAISTLDTRKSSDFGVLSKPLAKRAKTLLDKKSYKSDCHALYAGFILSWLTADLKPLMLLNTEIEQADRFNRKYNLDSFEQLIWGRMRTILERVSRGVYLPLPGLPTHAGGWLSPEFLNARCEIWQQHNMQVEEVELIFCLMRLPPTERVALGESTACPQLLRQALKALQIVPDASSKGTGLTDAVTGAIQHIKELLGKDSILLRMAHEANLPLQQRKIWRDELFSITFHLDRTRWQCHSFPAMRESFLDRGVTLAQSQINYSDSQVRALRGYFEVLLERHAALFKRSNTLLTTGLFLADPEIIGLTVDTLIIAVEERRLVVAELGNEIIPFLHGEISKQTRFAKTLKEVCRISPLHKNAVVQILEYSLHGPEDGATHDFWAVLELLHELLLDTDAKLSDAQTISYLESLTGSKSGGKSTSKTGKLAAKILAL